MEEGLPVLGQSHWLALCLPKLSLLKREKKGFAGPQAIAYSLNREDHQNDYMSSLEEHECLNHILSQCIQQLLRYFSLNQSGELTDQQTNMAENVSFQLSFLQLSERDVLLLNLLRTICVLKLAVHCSGIATSVWYNCELVVN